MYKPLKWFFLSELTSLLGQRSEAQEQKIREILSWLSPLNFGTNQQDFLSRRQEGTGEWLLNDNVFKAWLDGANKILWCPGIRMFPLSISFSILSDAYFTVAGAGKTILAYNPFYL